MSCRIDRIPAPPLLLPNRPQSPSNRPQSFTPRNESKNQQMSLNKKIEGIAYNNVSNLSIHII